VLGRAPASLRFPPATPTSRQETPKFRSGGNHAVVSMTMARTAAVLLTALTLTSCDRKTELEAPPPRTSADVDSLPAMPPSLLEVPLTYDLTPVVAQLEKAIPKKFGDLDKKQEIPGNDRMHFAYAAERDPFTVSLDGNTARIRAVIHYAGRGWYNAPVAPEVSASCGTNDQRPRAIIELTADLTLTSDWRLRSRSRVGEVAAFSEEDRDQCRITFLKMNVTDKVTDAARKQLQAQTTEVDARIASLDLRSKFEQWWKLISQPIRLTDSVWLQINPMTVSKGETSGQKKMLTATVGLKAAPRIITGMRPATTAKPLPPLDPAVVVGDGFHILMEAALDYDMASSLMTKELAGKRIERAGQYVEVRSLRVFGIGGGQLALELRFAGTTGGRVFFVGTPTYDGKTDQLYVPDLDYDVASADAIVRGLAWMNHDDIRDFLRARARWPVGGLLAQARTSLLGGLNRELAPGVRLSGEVTHVEALGVHAGLRAVMVRAHADGSLRLDIRPVRN
jgi:predicted small lipoprotein YifL